MNWDQLGLWSTSLLGVALILRLRWLRIESVYRVFCFYVAYQIGCSIVVAFLLIDVYRQRAYYPVVYLVMLAVGWAVTLWVVYALLETILKNLPGIWRFSRIFLQATFVASLPIGIITGQAEIADKNVPLGLMSLNSIVMTATTIERVISTVALLDLLIITTFFLWFPVEMPRNLARFSIGFIVYFLLKNLVFISRLVWPGVSWYESGTLDLALTAVCYAVWLFVINAKGERVPVRIGHSWRQSEQNRLIHQLDAINRALLAEGKRGGA
jgi:hypothetical protein